MHGINISLIRLDKLKEMSSSKEEERLVTWLRLINAKSKEELIDYAKGDELFMNLINDMSKYTSNPEIFEECHIEDWKLESAEEYGIEQGIEKQAYKTAKIMLSRNYPIKEVSELTSLPISKLKNLKF